MHCGFSFIKSLHKKKTYSLYIRWTACIVLLTFAPSLSTDLAYANGMVQSEPLLQPFLLPDTTGIVVERYQGTGKEKIILIQDLHCDPAVQYKIQSIIQVAQDTYGDALTMIGIEGTSAGPIDTSLLTSIPNKIIRMNVTDHFVQRGDISGGELFVIGSGKNSVHAYGLEDLELYRRNFDALYTSLSYRDEMQTVCTNIRNGVAYAKPYLYTKEALSIEATAHAYTTHVIDTATYLAFLKGTSEKYGVRIEQTYPHIAHVIRSIALKKKLNYTMINNEMNDIIQTVFPKLSNEQRAGLAKAKARGVDVYYEYVCTLLSAHQMVLSSDFTYTKEYGMYLDTVQAIDDVKVIEECDALKYQLLFLALRNRRDGLQLAQTERYVTLMEEYVCNQASERGTEEWRSVRDRMYTILHDVSNRMLQKNYFDDNETIIKYANDTMDSFYQDAVKRNEILAHNMIEQSRACKSPVSICIVGGFHREGIANILKSKGISYDIVLPRIDTEYDNRLYMRRIQEQAQQYGIGTGLNHNVSITPYRNAMMVETRCGTPEFGQDVWGELCATLEATEDVAAIESFFRAYRTRLESADAVTVDMSSDNHSCKVQMPQRNYTHTFLSNWYVRVRDMRIASVDEKADSKQFAAVFTAAYQTDSQSLMPYCMSIFDAAAAGNTNCASVLRDISVRNRDVMYDALRAYVARTRKYSGDGAYAQIAKVISTMTQLDEAHGRWKITRIIKRAWRFFMYRIVFTMLGIARYIGKEYRTGTDQAAKMLYMLGITEAGRRDAVEILNALYRTDNNSARNVLARMYSFDANRKSKKIQWHAAWVTEFQEKLDPTLLAATTKKGRLKIVAIMTIEIIALAAISFIAYSTPLPLVLLLLLTFISAFCADDLIRTLVQSHQWLRKWITVTSLVAFFGLYLLMGYSIITGQWVIVLFGFVLGAALTVITSEYPRFSFLWQRKTVVSAETEQANEAANRLLANPENFSNEVLGKSAAYAANVLYQCAMKDTEQVHGMDTVINILQQQTPAQQKKILQQMYMLHDSVHPDIAWPEKRLLEFEQKIERTGYGTVLREIKTIVRRQKTRTYIVASILGLCFYALLLLFVFTDPMLLIFELIAGSIIFFIAKADRQVRRMIMATGGIIFGIGLIALLLGSPLGYIIGSYGLVFLFFAWYAESSTTGFFRGAHGEKGWKENLETGSVLLFAFGIMILFTLLVAGILNVMGLLIGIAVLGLIGIGIVLLQYIQQRIQQYRQTHRNLTALGRPLLEMEAAVFLGLAGTTKALRDAGYTITTTVLDFVKAQRAVERLAQHEAEPNARDMVDTAFETQQMQKMTVSVRDVSRVSVIVTEPVTEVSPAGATAYFSTGMMTLLERLHGIAGAGRFRLLVEETATHEAMELDSIRQGNDPEDAHTEALRSAGTLQRALYDSMDTINRLQLLEYQISQGAHFDCARAQSTWDDSAALQEHLSTIAGRAVTNDEIFTHLFPGLQHAYRNGIERYPREIIISLKDVHGGNIEEYLRKFGVLDGENLQANVRVVLVGDIARYDDPTAVAAAATTLEHLYTHRGTGSDIVWVLGTTALQTANEDTRQGKAVRALLTKGIGQAVTVLADGRLATSGFVDEVMLAEIARVHQGQRDVHSVADVLNTALEFRARAINVAGIEVLASPVRAQAHIPRLSVEEIRHLLDLSTTLIYGAHGLVHNTDPTNYAAAHAALRQVAFNIAAAIPPELVSVLEADHAVVRRHNVLPTGAVLMETVSRDFRGREQHIDIRVVARPVTTLWMTSTADMMMRRVMSLTHIMIGISVVEPLKVGDVVEFMFGDKAADRDRVARYKALSAAA